MSGSRDLTLPTRQLGSDGPSVSTLTLGNWLTHGGMVRDDIAAATVRAALDVGITTFDTADEYAGGVAEEALGASLAGIPRDSVRICTKVFFPTWPGPDGHGLSRRHILASCDASLARLGVDYLDLYLAHRFDPDVSLGETFEAFSQLHRAGKIHYVGVSEWTASQIAEGLKFAAAAGVPLVTNQVQYSLLWRAAEAQVAPAATAAGLGLMAYSPLAQGVLTAKYRPGELPANSRAARCNTDASIFRAFSDDLLEVVQQAARLAREASLTLREVALAWTLNQPGVTTAVIGASDPEQVRQNARAAHGQLDPDLVAALDAVLLPWVESDPAKVGRGWSVRQDWRGGSLTGGAR